MGGWWESSSLTSTAFLQEALYPSMDGTRAVCQPTSSDARQKNNNPVFTRNMQRFPSLSGRLWWGVPGDIITFELSVAWPNRYPSSSSTVSDLRIGSGHVCSLRMTKADGPGFDLAFSSPGLHPHHAPSPRKGSRGSVLPVHLTPN